MKRLSIFYTLFFLGLFAVTTCTQRNKVSAHDEASKRGLVNEAFGESDFLSEVTQIVSDGLRSGEAYFSHDGSLLVYQAEKLEENPFYQIYLKDFNGSYGKEDLLVSNGVGKTTCAWIHPNHQSVLYASTHLDPLAVEKQNEELSRRESGEQRRYAWDYDPNYDLFSRDFNEIVNQNDFRAVNLTQAWGYDAEGSYSPDGTKILFASNRHGYTDNYPDDIKQEFEHNPSILIDLYIMNNDGTGVKRLTNNIGYDGGPFFNKEGNKIIWRRFDRSGRVGEIMTMDIDLNTLETSEPKQITHLNAVSWAPYIHPSGKYMIFTSTYPGGHANFELMIGRLDGSVPPVRVTETTGADVLPVFSPDGNELVWSSQRNEKHQAHVYRAKWNHNTALKALGYNY